MQRICWYASGLLVATMGAAAPPIGEQAPEIKVAKWITTEPPVLPGQAGAEKHVFLVDFWATWLPKCRATTVHLAKLQEKHEKDGLIVIGISNEDAEPITRFIEEVQRLPYSVAADDDMATSGAWTEEVLEIPYAFVIDRSGVIVWRGDTAADTEAMDRAVEQALAGKIDVPAIKEATEKTEKFNKLMNELRTAYAMRNQDKVFKLLDEMIALKPLELEPYLIKREALRNFDLTEKVSAWEDQMIDALKDSAEAMRQLASVELGKDISERSPAVMVRAVGRANELGKGEDAEALLLMGRVQCELGMLDEAIATQTKAVKLATMRTKEYYEKVLEYYRAAKKLRKELKTPTATSRKA